MYKADDETNRFDYNTQYSYRSEYCTTHTSAIVEVRDTSHLYHTARRSLSDDIKTKYKICKFGQHCQLNVNLPLGLC